MIIKLILLLLLCSCAFVQKEIRKDYIWAGTMPITVLSDDFSFYSEFEREKIIIDHLSENLIFKSYLIDLKTVSFSTQNCDQEDIACTFPSQKHAIFLTHNFMGLHPAERVSTLFHEAWHLKNRDFDHVSCKKGVSNSCDEDRSKGYGLELEILTAIKEKKLFDPGVMDILINNLKYKINNL